MHFLKKVTTMLFGRLFINPKEEADKGELLEMQAQVIEMQIERQWRDELMLRTDDHELAPFAHFLLDMRASKQQELHVYALMEEVTHRIDKDNPMSREEFEQRAGTIFPNHHDACLLSRELIWSLRRQHPFERVVDHFRAAGMELPSSN